jgi:SpoIID/LytB domain protein
VVPLASPIRIEAPGGLLWTKGAYDGPDQLLADAHGGWSLVVQVPLERYLEGVLPHEIGSGSPPQALAAQAVLARTWSLRNQHRYAADGYHLCVTTQCQVYSDPRAAGVAVREAIGRTRGLVLSWQDQPIHAVYHASNGGLAAGLEEAWNAGSQPYLRPALDRVDGPAERAPLPRVSELAQLLGRSEGFVGADHPLFRWSRWLDRQQIAQALGRQGLQVGQVQRLAVLERGPSGRVTALAIEGSTGRTVLRIDAIRRTLRSLPSTLFVLTPQGPGRWLVQGGGFGHGVGLSQAGAIDLGRRGWSFSRILERYYPGTRLQPLAPSPPLPPPQLPGLGGDP